VRPATRVRITVCVTSGRVSVSPAAAIAAIAEETPGTTPPGRCRRRRAARHLDQCAIEAGIAGLQAHDDGVAGACSISQAVISSSVMSFESRISQPAGANRVAAWSTSEPANRSRRLRSSRRGP
jgi:hypothetical protein